MNKEIIMYRVMTDLDGKHILTYSGWRMPFWFSNFRYDCPMEAFDAPDRFDFF